ncbi:MAG TPA: DUF998 domain-containing protein [Puia sp.]|nr:DUF998 domain-containing protein [Puia sp.]
MIKKILSLSFLFLSYCIGFPQQKLPVLRSDSTTINIKIDNESVGFWQVDTDTKPGTDFDIFRMDRSFSTKKVAYISDKDSVSFNVKPGDKYDFFILLNNKSFPTEVTMADEPVFLHTNIIIIVLSSLIIIALVIFSKRRSLNTRSLLYLGIISPLLFWIVTITGGFIHGNYNHLHNVVSELGAIGTRSEIFMSATEILVAILSILSVIGFYKACRQTGANVIPVLTILSLSISMFWAATFPMHHELHGALGPVPLILNFGVLLAIILWRRKKFFPIRMISVISFILMMLILLRIIPELRGNYEGLIQRFFYFGWTVWSISLSLFFIKEIENKDYYAA